MTLSLTVKDWNGSHVAELSDVSVDTTVGEVVEEVTEAMNLPRHTPYALVDRRARKLPHSFTLAEAGIENGEEVQVAADVRAGHDLPEKRGARDSSLAPGGGEGCISGSLSLVRERFGVKVATCLREGSGPARVFVNTTPPSPQPSPSPRERGPFETPFRASEERVLSETPFRASEERVLFETLFRASEGKDAIRDPLPRPGGEGRVRGRLETQRTRS